MVKKRIMLPLLMFVLLFSVNLDFVVGADERVGFSVQAHLPENQLDSSLTYFDLRVEQGVEQELVVTVYNHEAEDITVQADIYNASTNSNGLIVYEEQDEIDSSLKEPITELVTLETGEFTIPAGKSETIGLIMTVPKEEFDGIKLGGIHIEKLPGNEEVEEGVNIQNKYAYVIGLQLSANDSNVLPELALDAVEPQLVNHRTAVIARVQNSAPVLIDNVTIKADIFAKDDEKLVKSKKQEDIKMAPNSTMDFVIDWNNERLVAGDYQLEMTATDGENKWEWQEEFIITKEEEKVNERAVELASSDEKNQVGWYIAGMVGLLAVIVALILNIRRLKKA